MANRKLVMDEHERSFTEGAGGREVVVAVVDEKWVRCKTPSRNGNIRRERLHSGRLLGKRFPLLLV